jgi:hypothetical protein
VSGERGASPVSLGADESLPALLLPLVPPRRSGCMGELCDDSLGGARSCKSGEAATVAIRASGEGTESEEVTKSERWRASRFELGEGLNGNKNNQTRGKKRFVECD